MQGEWCVSIDPQNGATAVQILKINEYQAGHGNEDFEYTINMSIDIGWGQERVTCDSKLTPFDTKMTTRVFLLSCLVNTKSIKVLILPHFHRPEYFI